MSLSTAFPLADQMAHQAQSSLEPMTEDDEEEEEEEEEKEKKKDSKVVYTYTRIHTYISYIIMCVCVFCT
jgi:negative regulator of genetic competence, sporulation and motility